MDRVTTLCSNKNSFIESRCKVEFLMKKRKKSFHIPLEWFWIYVRIETEQKKRCLIFSRIKFKKSFEWRKVKLSAVGLKNVVEAKGVDCDGFPAKSGWNWSYTSCPFATIEKNSELNVPSNKSGKNQSHSLSGAESFQIKQIELLDLLSIAAQLYCFVQWNIHLFSDEWENTRTYTTRIENNAGNIWGKRFFRLTKYRKFPRDRDGETLIWSNFKAIKS